MNKIVSLCCITGLALVGACASPGMIQVAHDTYMIYREDHAGVFGNAARMKPQVMSEASAFAAKQGKIAVPLSIRETPVGLGPGQWATIEYTFRLADKDDPAIKAGSNLPPPPASPPPAVSPAPVVAGTGTAFAVITSRTLVTAYHVIQGSSSVEVNCGWGSPVQAIAEKIDPANDLALLSIPKGAPAFLLLADDGGVKTGQKVFTIGFPVPELLGMEPKYSEGSVSSTTGIGGASSLLQITVPVQPGNSGGPLVDTNGRIVGVVTSSAAVAAFLRVTGTLPQNINWAVRSEYLRPMLGSLVHASANTTASVVDRVKASVCLVTSYQ